MDFVQLDRRAMQTTSRIVSMITSDQLDLPTPCTGWAVRDLLQHMIVQHHGFAAAVAGQRTDLAFWAPKPLRADFGAEYAEAADVVLAAFAEPAESAHLPEVRGGITVPSQLAISFHFVDYVVHGWDVAAAIGVPIEFDDEVLDGGLAVAGQVPNGPERTEPGASFAPALATGDGAGKLDRILTQLGRSPGWPN